MSKHTATPIDEKTLIAAMNKVFTEGKWEIPDEAVVGLVKNKVDNLEAQVKSLTNLLKQLAAQVNDQPVNPSGRVDALAAAKKK